MAYRLFAHLLLILTLLCAGVGASASTLGAAAHAATAAVLAESPEPSTDAVDERPTLGQSGAGSGDAPAESPALPTDAAPAAHHDLLMAAPRGLSPVPARTPCLAGPLRPPCA